MTSELTTEQQSLLDDAGRDTEFNSGGRDRGYRHIYRFLDHQKPATPCLVIDLAVIRRRYAQLRQSFDATTLCYAVKANPDPQVVGLLVELGCSFDVASIGEIELCLAQGAPPEAISYGNTIKKRSDVARAYELGVRVFATDSWTDLDNIAEVAPGASVFCRVLVDGVGARTPFGEKFGCTPDMAAQLLRRARTRGLDPCGVSFHIGSQQLNPAAWDNGIAAARTVFDALRDVAQGAWLVNLGGGLPASYTQSMPPLSAYAEAIHESLRRHFAGDQPHTMLEPGRFMVADAGVLRSEVILTSTKGIGDGRRWVYLDIGRYNGLAETEGEAITYRLATARDGQPVGPVVLAGPTCDGDDVIYQKTVYELPLTLDSGDRVDLLSAGAYTASYSSVEFNGFAPLPTYCVDSDRHDPDGINFVETDSSRVELDGHGEVLRV